ncbi:hypothetical protein Tco_1419509 [Tanacetum coccineum]
MVDVAMKHMALNFAKLDKFEGVDFRRWQKKMHFLLSSISVVFMLTTPIPEDGGDDATVEQLKKRAKWMDDDVAWWVNSGARVHVCIQPHSIVLNWFFWGMSQVFSVHRILESLCKIERGVKNDIEPIAPTMTVNRLILE